MKTHKYISEPEHHLRGIVAVASQILEMNNKGFLRKGALEEADKKLSNMLFDLFHIQAWTGKLDGEHAWLSHLKKTGRTRNGSMLWNISNKPRNGNQIQP
jgi:hypothetical protein